MPSRGATQRRMLAGSEALREASVRTEVRRAWAVIGVIGLVMLLVVRGGAAYAVDRRLIWAGAAGLGVLMAVQVVVLGLARWARRRARTIPTWILVVTVVVEALIPTAILLSHISGRVLPPYTAMSSPPVLAYGLMIVLTALRLRPWMCILAGGTAAAGYLGLLAYATSLGATPIPGLPREAYVNSALFIFISGVAAAWVAHEIRGHFVAAMREAETRREMARIEQDLGVARSIQQALLPRESPRIEGYQIAGWNRPADQTGGDYYDWQRMPDGTWIVTLADVSGHGIGPAMVTAACRAYVRASTAHHGDLGSLASRINALLAEDLPDGRFITMASVIVRPADGGQPGGPLALLSAGHGPIVLYASASGVVRDIMPQDLPLAIAPDARFGPAQAVQMVPGDVLALVTDGFVEWAKRDGGAGGRGEQFGIERLRESVRRHAHLAAGAAIEAIAREVEAFAEGERQQDDLTMVLIRRV